MDPTLVTILLLLVFATVIAVVQSRHRDKCLRDFDRFHVTLAEKGGDLSWGHTSIYPSGLEVHYLEPVSAPEGHEEHSFLFYKDQYAAIEGLYRYTESLSSEEKERRRTHIEQTVHPTPLRRLRRRLRNWINMVRDALMQSSALLIGAAKTRAPGSAVLSTQEQQLKSLSNEIIGHAGNAFDPLLEDHLFQEVVLEVTHDGHTRSYSGWLKDYTSHFIQIVDAQVNTGEREPVKPYAVGQTPIEGVSLSMQEGQLHISNTGERMLYADRLTAGSWTRRMGTILPPTYTANLPLPEDVDTEQLRAHIGTAGRVDMVVPRTHAIVRHAACTNPKQARKRPQTTPPQQPAQISAEDIFSHR